MYMSVFSTAGWILRLGRDDRPARRRSIPALALLAVFALPTVGDVVVAAGGRAGRPGAGARRSSASPATCSRRPRPRRPARRCGSRGSATAWPHDRRASWERWYALVARGPVRPRRSGTRWRGPSSAPGSSATIVFVADGPRSARRRRALRARRRVAAVGLHRRHRGRDRVPSRHLDGRLATAGVARGLRGVGGGAGRPARARSPRRGHPLRGRPLRVPGHDDVGAPGCRPADPGRLRRRHRRGERRRQDHAGEAPVEVLRADVRADPRGRRRPLADCPPRSGGSAWPARTRTSSASSSRPGNRSASATCPASTTSPRS